MHMRANTMYFNTADNILDVILLFWMKHDFYCYIWIGNILNRWINGYGLSIADIFFIASSAFTYQPVNKPDVIKETCNDVVFCLTSSEFNQTYLLSRIMLKIIIFFMWSFFCRVVEKVCWCNSLPIFSVTILNLLFFTRYIVQCKNNAQLTCYVTS